MAEAFPEKDDTSPQTSISLSSMTECPVCLETLMKPRSLPCHHTFCLECLETYITKVTSTEVADDTHASPPSLPCPVCRTLVLPPTSPMDTKQWASQFPTNNFVLGILEKRNKDKENTCKCSPCQKQDKNVDGTFFCKQCSLFMCMSCKPSFHDNLFTDHHVVSSTGGQHTTKQTISDEILCERHGEKMEYVCLDHAVIECYKCVIADHRQCLKVISVMEYLAEIRERGQVTETMSDLARGSQDMMSLAEAFELHTGIMKDSEDAVIQELNDMLKLFLEIKQKVETNLSKKTKASIQKNQDKIKYFDSLGKSMANTNAVIDAVMSEGNEVHLVSHMLKAQAEIRTCKQLSNHILTSWPKERLSLDLTPNLESLKRTMQSPEEHITLSKQTFPMAKLSLPLYGRSAKLVSTFQINTGSSRVTGSLFLENGGLFLVDYGNSCLILYNKHFICVDNLTLHDRPADCCRMEQTIAVTCPTSGIGLVQIENEKLALLRQIKLSMGPCGIASVAGHLIVTFSDVNPRCIQRVSENGCTEMLSTISERPTRMASRDEKIFISNVNCKLGEPGVRSISVDDCSVLKIKSDIVAGSRGLDFDKEGNLYVCGRESGNVIQISEDRLQCRDILTGLGEVESVAFNGNHFFLSIDKSSDGYIYELV